jgi:hypothetical protein
LHSPTTSCLFYNPTPSAPRTTHPSNLRDPISTRPAYPSLHHCQCSNCHPPTQPQKISWLRSYNW